MSETISPSKSLVEDFLLKNLTTNSHNVANKAMSSENGLDESARGVLHYIHSLPQAYNFEPHIVRKNRINPFEHESVQDVSREDIKIQLPGRDLLARIYRPINDSSIPLASLVYLHGGGFVLGDIASYDKMLAQMCSQSGVAIISVEYRLAPETVFPGAVEDTVEAMEWIFTNSERLNIDNTKIAIGGDSAGGNLATVYCILNQGRDSYQPCLQLLIYPSIIGNDTSKSRAQFSEKLLLSKELLKWFHDHYIDKANENDPRFNVLNFNDFADVPPAFVITAGFDPLRDEGQMYVNTLRESGVTTKHSCYTDMFHGFINFGTLKQAQEVVRECAEVLKGTMSNKEISN